MKSILRNVAGLAIATVLAFGMFSCNIGNNEEEKIEPTPTEITLTCKKCGEIYNIYSKPTKVDGICDNCGSPLTQRKDDNEDALKVRLQHYVAQTKPLLDYYSKLDLLVNYDGSKSCNTLFDEISVFLKK